MEWKAGQVGAFIKKCSKRASMQGSRQREALTDELNFIRCSNLSNSFYS